MLAPLSPGFGQGKVVQYDTSLAMPIRRLFLYHRPPIGLQCGSPFRQKMSMPCPPPPFAAKLCPPQALAARAAGLPRPLVFTNGCFDILHRGHVTYLARARALGAALIVAINGDESVRRLGKGANRPLNPLEDRLAVVAALESVDLVTWFEEDTPLERILDARPDVLAKGGDWPVEAIVGASEVRGRGGSVHSIPFEFERSTSALVERIRAAGTGRE
jgi:rfaE bifunctional protein nucleotidyltransferase chain/domain